MPIGPGKYDDLCTLLRERAGIGEQGGGVLVIVLGGNRGNGFSCQADLATTMALPVRRGSRRCRREHLNAMTDIDDVIEAHIT